MPKFLSMVHVGIKLWLEAAAKVPPMALAHPKAPELASDSGGNSSPIAYGPKLGQNYASNRNPGFSEIEI